MLVLKEDGTITGGSTLSLNQQGVSSKDGKVKNVGAYLEGKTVVDIAATNNCYAAVLSDGSFVVFGGASYGEKDLPTVPAGENAVSVTAGTRHFVIITDKGNAYSWGHNDHGQASLQGVSADNVFCGSKQTYVIDENDDVVRKVGLKGYAMGTDSSGRDILTRIIHGGKMTMTVGAVAVIVSTIIAIIIGCVSGYFGGWVDMLLMRFTEICSSIPFLPFAMMLSYVIQGKAIKEETRIVIIMVMLGVLSWPGLARMIRAQVLAEREKEFVIAAKSMGIKEKAIAFKHILPNVISIILVNVTLDFAGCMLTESSLSYLGFGVQQPQPTWGNMLNGAKNGTVIQNFWWQWLFPSIFLAIATISINIIGDTLRDVFDPKSSSER
jgi:peptide/nickel transport system permease protein